MKMRTLLRNGARRTWYGAQRFYSVRENVTLGRDVHVGRGAVLQNVTVGHNVHIGRGTVLDAPHRLSVGDHVYVGRNCTLECDGSIGSYVLIANHVGIIGRYDHDHTKVGTPIRMAPWIGDSDYHGRGRGLTVRIDDDVWLGYSCVVLTGVTVGRGAVVGAGAVVTRDVAPYAIVAGQPARQVGRRFSPEQAQRHEMLLAEQP